MVKAKKTSKPSATSKKAPTPNPIRIRTPTPTPNPTRTPNPNPNPTPRSLYAGSSPLPFDTLAALAHLHAADPVLSKLMTRVGPFALQTEAGHAPFQALTESILHQQVTGKAAAAILGRFRATFGLREAFPTPERVVSLSDEQLRAVGISRSKAAAIRDLAAKTLDGTVPDAVALHGMLEEEIITRLTAVRGIGVWTVHMLLMFRLGRPDVLPVGDYGVRKGFKKTFRSKNELPTPGEIAKRAERWRPYRTVASWYLWRALELK
jgi:3-methyladenine DNA glycosylase/8-oxoguanine DNA glycosylase